MHRLYGAAAAANAISVPGNPFAVPFHPVVGSSADKDKASVLTIAGFPGPVPPAKPGYFPAGNPMESLIRAQFGVEASLKSGIFNHASSPPGVKKLLEPHVPGFTGSPLHSGFSSLPYYVSPDAQRQVASLNSSPPLRQPSSPSSTERSAGASPHGTTSPIGFSSSPSVGVSSKYSDDALQQTQRNGYFTLNMPKVNEAFNALHASPPFLRPPVGFSTPFPSTTSCFLPSIPPAGAMLRTYGVQTTFPPARPFVHPNQGPHLLTSSAGIPVSAQALLR